MPFRSPLWRAVTLLSVALVAFFGIAALVIAVRSGGSIGRDGTLAVGTLAVGTLAVGTLAVGTLAVGTHGVVSRHDDVAAPDRAAPDRAAHDRALVATSRA